MGVTFGAGSRSHPDEGGVSAPGIDHSCGWQSEFLGDLGQQGSHRLRRDHDFG